MTPSKCPTKVCKLSPEVFRCRSSVKRIKAHCLDCTVREIDGTALKAVRACTGRLLRENGNGGMCWLHPFRLGKNPDRPRRTPAPDLGKKGPRSSRDIVTDNGQTSEPGPGSTISPGKGVVPGWGLAGIRPGNDAGSGSPLWRSCLARKPGSGKKEEGVDRRAVRGPLRADPRLPMQAGVLGLLRTGPVLPDRMGEDPRQEAGRRDRLSVFRAPGVRHLREASLHVPALRGGRLPALPLRVPPGPNALR
jgi:hypothetical protein